MPVLTVIIPANNEADYIGACLDALRKQTRPDPTRGFEIIVAANACTDETVPRVEAARSGLETAGWTLTVLDIADPGKLNALNTAEAQAKGRVLVYLDADVLCEPEMMRLLVQTLDVPAPRYASGHLIIAPARSWATRAFARVWAEVPFMKTNVQGAGLFALNRAGRARWGAFPDIIADDGFARLQFAPDERVKVDAKYHWPMVEGFANLVKVRRRQDQGVAELAAMFPELMKNESKAPMRITDHAALFAKMPISYLVYVAVRIAGKVTRAKNTAWVRGR